VASKSKKPATKKSSTAVAATSVTRIKAVDTKPAKKSDKKPVVVDTKKTAEPKKSKKSFMAVLRSIGGYFKGAWFELRQVRWPNRKATWSLTAAVLIFTAFFVVLVVLLDVLFKYLFELILK
jgi:preprotein translocase SecE subunit